MTKATDPVLLSDDLMQTAARIGRQFNRSATEQVEYWASLGRILDGTLDQNKLVEIALGLSQLHVEPIDGEPMNSNTKL